VRIGVHRNSHAHALALAELTSARSPVVVDGANTRLRQWTSAFGDAFAWAITSAQLQIAADAMIDGAFNALGQ
jgi:hypothetical protein